MPRSTCESLSHYMHQELQPPLFQVSSSLFKFEPVDLQVFPTFESFLAQVLVLMPPSPPLSEGSEVNYWFDPRGRDANPRLGGPTHTLCSHSCRRRALDCRRRALAALDLAGSRLVPPPLVTAAVNYAASPPSPGAGIVLL